MSKFTALAGRFIVPAPAASGGGLRLAFDCEADALLHTAKTVHCIVVAPLDNDEIYEYGPEQIKAGLEHLARADYLVGHNLCGYDLPLLGRLYGWSPAPSCIIRDTLIASRLILPHIRELDIEAAARGDASLGKLHGKHSLDAWGARLGMPKIGTDITDWSQWTPEMQARCVGDVRITKALWRFLQPDGYSQRAMELEHRVAAICNQIQADGVPFNRAAAEALRQQWESRRAELEAPLRKQFPVINLASRQQLGAMLLERGWTPDKYTEKTHQPQIDDELLDRLPGLYPEFTGFIEYTILGRRLAALATGNKAWIKHIGADGRIHGGIIPIGTPHSRASHLSPNLAQVPNEKKGKPFAAECRALFRAPDGWACVAADQSNLQDRGFAHYLTAFDAGAYAKAFLSGEDTHWKTTAALGLIPHDVPRDKQSVLHTCLREGGKRFRYAFLYGCGAHKAGIILYDVARAAQQIDPSSDLLQKLFGTTGRPSEDALKAAGRKARNRFEANTPGLRELRAHLENHARNKGWLPGLDGRRVPSRSLHTSLNFIVTSSEAIICKRWLVRVHAELCERFKYGWDGDVVLALWIHDELVVFCRREIAEQVGEIMVRHAIEPGEFYKFKVPLDADFKIGRSWAGDTPEESAATAKVVWANRDHDIPVEVTPEPPQQGADGRLYQRVRHDGHETYVPRDELCDPPNKGTPRSTEAELPLAASKERPAAPLPPIQKTPTPEEPLPWHANGRGAGDGYCSGEAPRGAPTHKYVYRDADGQPYMRVTRTDGKSFPTAHWNGDQWVKRWPLAVIPYRLPELIAAPASDPVWICEGEKDADNVAALGLIATTNPGGAGKWKLELNRWFAGKQIAYILEDNDTAGRAHARKVANNLQGVIPDIRILSFPELPERGDVSDWLAIGGTRQELLARAQAAAKYECKLQSAQASSFTISALEWLWPNRFAIGKLGIIAGLPDEGKGLVLADMAARITRGLEWPCKEGCSPLGNVVMLSAEDDPSDTIVPRLMAAGADTERVELITMVRADDKDRMFSLVTDLELLRQKIVELGNIKLVQIDPISAYLGVGKIDSFRTTDVRAVLSPLVTLAAELKIAVVGIMHFNKKVDVTNALLRISDSLAFGATSRHVYAVINDAENKRKLFVKGKNNLAPYGQKALAFEFGVREVGTDKKTGEPISAPHIIWQSDYVDITASEAMQAAAESKAPAARDTAKNFLKQMLSNDPMSAADIEEAAEADGIATRTLYRAKAELKIRAVKDGPMKDGQRTWRWHPPAKG